MTDLTASQAITEAHSRAKLTTFLDRVFAGMGQGFNAYGERVARYEKIRRLHAKSDEELARMGLTRDGIVQHVFADLFYL